MPKCQKYAKNKKKMPTKCQKYAKNMTTNWQWIGKRVTVCNQNISISTSIKLECLSSASKCVWQQNDRISHTSRSRRELLGRTTTRRLLFLRTLSIFLEVFVTNLLFLPFYSREYFFFFLVFFPQRSFEGLETRLTSIRKLHKFTHVSTCHQCFTTRTNLIHDVANFSSVFLHFWNFTYPSFVLCVPRNAWTRNCSHDVKSATITKKLAVFITIFPRQRNINFGHVLCILCRQSTMIASEKHYCWLVFFVDVTHIFVSHVCHFWWREIWTPPNGTLFGSLPKHIKKKLNKKKYKVPCWIVTHVGTSLQSEPSK